VGDTLVLLKQAPDEATLDEWHGTHLVRASMSVRLGCWAWIGFVTAENTQTFMTRSAEVVEGTCNPPNPLNCSLGEIIAWLQKASMKPAFPEIGFAVVTTKYGSRASFARHVRSVVEDLGDDVYVAAGSLVGCGAQTELVEVMADDQDTVLRLLVELTDVEGVLDVRVLRGTADDTRGFGDEGQPAEAV
jgi:hypothetical protein